MSVVKKIEYETARIPKTNAVCPMCEDYAKENLTKPVMVISCEGACLRGEIARQAANLICHQLAPDQTARICLGGAFTKDGGQRQLVREGKRVIALEGCFIECASRTMQGVIPELEAEIIIADDLYEFVQLWKKALVEAKFTPDQLAKLSKELELGAQKLKENYNGLNGYVQQKAKATGEEAAKLQKRIDLKEGERDLIVSKIKLALEGFLTKDQVDLILMAGFHGVSLSLSGEQHLTGMHKDGKMADGKLGQMGISLGKLAEKINLNCEAITLELIRKNIK